MAGRSGRVQKAQWKNRDQLRRSQAALAAAETNARRFKQLSEAPSFTSASQGGAISARTYGWGNRTGWGFDDPNQHRPSRRYWYQLQVGDSSNVYSMRGAGTRMDKIYVSSQDQWQRMINAAYWGQAAEQEKVKLASSKVSEWKPIDTSKIRSSRGFGGSALGTSSTVVSVEGGGFASGESITGGVLSKEAGLQIGKDGSVSAIGPGHVVGTDSSGRQVYVKKSSTEESKAKKTGVAKYGEEFATGFKSTPDKSFAIDAQGKKYTSWDELKQKSKKKGATPTTVSSNQFISDYESKFGDITSLTTSQAHDFFASGVKDLESQERALLEEQSTFRAKGKTKLTQFDLERMSTIKAQLKGIKDEKSAKLLAKSKFMTNKERLAQAESINKSTKLQQEAKEELKKYIPVGANYLNPEQYSSYLESYQADERNIKAGVGSAYREALYGEDIRLEVDRGWGDGSTQFSKVGTSSDLDLQKQEQKTIKLKQRGQIQYEMPEGGTTSDPAIQRGRIRKIYYATKQELPEYKEQIKIKQAEVEQLRSQEKISDEQYRVYLDKISVETEKSKDVFRSSSGKTVHFDDSFAQELRKFGTKRKQTQLDLATNETELDALIKNVEATEEELERLKKIKTKMGGGQVGGGGKVVNPARMAIMSAKRGYSSAIMSKGERIARRRSGVTSSRRRPKNMIDTGGLVTQFKGRPQRNLFAFDRLRQLAAERRRILA